MGPAVLVMAEPPTAAGSSPLEPLLGAVGCAHLDRVLLRRAARWATESSPAAAFVALDPESPEPMVRDCVAAGVTTFPQVPGSAAERLEAATLRVLAEHGGPVAVVGTRFPRLGPYHAAAALGDLEDGCDVVLGVAIGGGLYMLGMREPQAQLFALAGDDEDGETTRRNARDVTEGLNLEVGMLHYERALVGPDDALALLADPLLPADLAEALARCRDDSA